MKLLKNISNSLTNKIVVRKRALMGRQINFYMSKSIQEAFIDYLCQNNFLFLDKKVSNFTGHLNGVVLMRM